MSSGASPPLSVGVEERALCFTGTLTCQVFFRSVNRTKRNLKAVVYLIAGDVLANSPT